jgi:hypothetical protein
VTHGDSGIIFPILILLILSLPILLLWVYKGAGDLTKRRRIGFTQILILASSIIMFFSGINLLQSIGLVTCFLITIFMLVTPITFKRFVS